MNKTEKLAARIRAADAAMEVHLAKLFPIGSRVSCYLMHGQRHPSKGDVIGHTGGEFAYVRIRLESRTRAVRNIPADEVRVL